MVPRHQRAVVGDGVVIKEKARRDVHGDEHVDGIMLMSSENEEETENVEEPDEGVEEVPVEEKTGHVDAVNL